jgi:hypothetical protein
VSPPVRGSVIVVITEEIEASGRAFHTFQNLLEWRLVKN